MLEPVNVSMESLNLITLDPMLIAVAGALTILIIDLAKDGLHKSLYVMVALLFLLLDFLFHLTQQAIHAFFLYDRFIATAIVADQANLFYDNIINQPFFIL